MPTVDRVLPWRRNDPPPADEVAPLLGAFRKRPPEGADGARSPGPTSGRPTRTAGQSRNSGEPYVSHPLAVARIVADLGLDDVTVAAALLHDAVEDTGITLDDIERDFGADVAAIVDGVTKLERIQFDSKEAQQAATMRKMLVAMAERPAGPDHQAGRPAPQHAHASPPCPRGSSSASPGRPSTSTPRWPTASACRT